MTDGEANPVAAFRQRLQDLFLRARRPAYRVLEAHANRDGRALRPSTISTLLNGPVTPRWETVETFVRACARYMSARQIRLPSELSDVERWHNAYRDMENAVADQAAERERIAGRAVPSRRRRLAVPGQLPADTAAFTGRARYLAELDKLLPTGDRPGTPAVVISAIDGTAGVGKTALAVHWAHRIRDRYPDGQLYVDLRGFDPSGQIMQPATAVHGFLEALDVPARSIPADPDARAALYRSLLIDKRMLIVLDNARDTAQIRPLLPGTSGCLVLVTSRNKLTSLIADTGADPVTLDLLTTSEARDLLARRLGHDRIAAEPDAVEEIIVRCARLPLALALVAAQTAVRAHTPLATFAEELRDTRQRWRTLTGDDPATSVQAVLSWSYNTLTPPAARLFRLLGLHPGPDIGTSAAANLISLPIDQVRPLLAELTQANLIIESSTGRYSFHDLLRSYAAGRAKTIDSDEDRRAGTLRMLDYYLHTAHAANLLLRKHRDLVVLSPPQPGVTPETLTDPADAMAWFAAEYRVLLAAIRQASASGIDTYTWQLSWNVGEFLDLRSDWHDAAQIQEAAVDAAQRAGDRTGVAFCHRSLARTYRRLGRYDDAQASLRRALAVLDELGDVPGQALVRLSISVVLDQQKRHREAIQLASQALDLFRRTGHRAHQATALNTIGWFHAQLGEYHQALAQCRQALSLHDELSNRREAAATWDSLGYAHQHLGQYGEAVTAYQHAIDMFQELNDRYNQAEILTRLGDTQAAAGNDAAAGDAWRQALTILTDLAHPDVDPVRAKLAALGTRLDGG